MRWSGLHSGIILRILKRNRNVTRKAHPTLLSHLSRPLSTSSTLYATKGPDFDDTSLSYGGKSMRQLLRAFLVYQLFSFNSIVDSSERLLKVAKKILGQSLFRKLMKWTIYGQFVAGEDLKTLQPAMKHLQSRGVRSILDYAVEDDVQNSEVYMEVRHKAKPPSDILHVTTGNE
ncbi:PREDICTED: proline dehydrogenase 1, mitochondrial-like [Amphimedon queenslandica]|uniref:Proline dehydrogenase n=1 Tax=Amphimedon queenslandica TaxID=400682 RepID=A0A1X7SYA8_AMPQE|nr:PREDICTED: proline dehydrogenase 1, mitochondrial-like [Amphimedon queenslandica]|eukprot:XP_011408613.2 PREDICTED: proline dehydrogenase 1, mitochondrial-like [Amphimedon queenslandica]